MSRPLRAVVPAELRLTPRVGAPPSPTRFVAAIVHCLQPSIVIPPVLVPQTLLPLRDNCGFNLQFGRPITFRRLKSP